ncbi:MAG: AAA family ATPase [Deltaproteobacteria bacterium]|jgi:hypothetical protein|nr:AAA family ATPase [Deltaproteobacteria bacterium]
MISSVVFTSGYPTRLRGIGRRRLAFNDRINVLFGPNGSGKTTILKTLAAASGCGRGGWSDGRRPEPLPYGVKVERDAQPVFYQDCYRDSEKSFVGVDYLEAHAYLRSTGEKRIGLVNELVDDIEGRLRSRKLGRNERPTLLLDEVDNHVGFAGQSILWGDLFGRLSKRYQIIISTHSIFPVLLRRNSSLRQDNIVVLAERYAEICVLELGKAIKRFNATNALGIG